MGVQPYLLASTISGVTAQRLIRVLCPHCKKAIPAAQNECDLLKVSCKPPPTLYHAVGCKHCSQTGFAGRTGIYETIAIDEKLRAMIHDNTNAQDMESYAHKSAPNIQQDGFAKVLTGVTSLEEVLRVTVKV